MKTANENMKKVFNGKTFAEILAEVVAETEEKAKKEFKMIQTIDEQLEEIKKEISEYGDIITTSCDFIDCKCGCGSVRIEVDFIAMKLESDGIGVTEGKISRIIKSE